MITELFVGRGSWRAPLLFLCSCSNQCHSKQQQKDQT